MRVKVIAVTRALEDEFKSRVDMLDSILDQNWNKIVGMMQNPSTNAEEVGAEIASLLHNSALESEIDEKEIRRRFDNLGGHAAGVCYMKETFDKVIGESQEKTDSRIAQTKTGGHHSCYDHSLVTLEIEGLPKLLAMILNNEKQYTTSEKSARYTEMQPTPRERILYDKWLGLVEKRIFEVYPDWTGDKQLATKAHKLAQENARYQISVMTPTTMIYTTTYRQISYLYQWLCDVLEQSTENEFILAVAPAIEEFCYLLLNTGLIDATGLKDTKNRKISLIQDKIIREEYFGDVYSVNYQGSFAQLAQAQRHRTLYYEMAPSTDNIYYVPKILRTDANLAKMWLEDIETVRELLPQGLQVDINERGVYEMFILKLKERLCDAAQLEICDQSRATLLRYAKALQTNKHHLQEDIQKYLGGARCTFPDYTCPKPCGKTKSIQLDRDI